MIRGNNLFTERELDRPIAEEIRRGGGGGS